MSSGDPLFLDVDDVLEIHAAQLEVHVNGIGIAHSSDELYALTMRVAEGGVDKHTIAVELEHIAKSR